MLSRRRFVRTTAGAAGAIAFTGTVPNLRATAAQAIPRRRSLGRMDLDDPVLDTFRDFVRIMQESSREGQPVSWRSFSERHGDASGFNLCPHGNWYFTPWHRGYLRMYEAAARHLTGNAEFALPYWDWTADRQMPRAFSDASYDNKPNPLHTPGRWMSTNDSLADNIVGQQQVMENIYAETNFEAFGSTRPRDQADLDPFWIQTRHISSQLEATPHDNIHCIVGGDYMCSGASPMDPIFLAHHCNIDRVWAAWNWLGRVNPTNRLWLEMPFADHFIAPDGTDYTDLVADLQDPTALGYTYGLAAGTPVSESVGRTLHMTAFLGDDELLVAAGIERFASQPDIPAGALQPLSVPIAPNEADLRSSIDPTLTTPIEMAGLQPQQVYAVVRDIRPSAPEETQLRVFVNCDYLSQTCRRAIRTTSRRLDSSAPARTAIIIRFQR